MADRYDQRADQFADGGKLLQTMGSSDPNYFAYLSGVALDGAGNVYVRTPGADDVDVLSSSGAFLRSWCGTGAAPSQFKSAGGVAVDGAGDAYVADTGNQRVQRFDRNGAFLQAWGALGAGAGQFVTTLAVAATSSPPAASRSSPKWEQAAPSVGSAAERAIGKPDAMRPSFAGR